jgi:site-specific DNA-cytosine methylase
MAERPLYTLYKNLKAQNYDVPNDYNKFESALTRDGKSGADNRHAIYNNLKAQNFDVPDTYERFYSALFEPRSKTSSRAKGGSVPMSAADRARFSAGAAAISASAKQIANNAGRYNRLKQRKQKQQKDFGRVNLGTHLTPYGGDANNVVKDEFAYNPETGKAGAYVTSDNENAYTQSDAEQKQNLLDKYGEEWNNAVDMGIVPSELDKADPDLSDTDVAMRQMERRQEWLNENQDRRSNELNESMHLQGSPFVASGGAVAPSSFNTSIGNEANRLSDVEYGAYNTAKSYNQMLRTTLLQELKEQKQRSENAGWWKDKWNDVSNYFGGMLDTMLDPKLYSQGVMDAAMANNMLQVKKGMEDGTIKKGSNAGNAAQVMLSAIQQQQGEAAKQQQYGTKAYQYGDMSGRSLKFMADFALSGWRNVMTTGFTKAGEKVGEKMALGALGKWFTKNTGRVLGDIAGSAALAATNQLGSTYNNVIERYVGMNNENGGVTQDNDGDLKFNEGVSLGKAIKDGFGSATIENFSEMFGEYLPGASKLLSKLGLSKVSSFFEKIGNNAYYKWLSNATNKSGIQGVMAEISEEEFGTALHAAWGDGDGSWSDFNVFTNPDAREKQIDTCLGMFYSVGFMQAPRTAVGAINAVRYFNIKHQVTKADKFGQMMFNDKWDEIKSKIDVTTNADLTKTVLDATRSDSMTAKQKDAVINYAMFLSKLRGFNQAADAKTKDKVEEGDTAPTLSNDLDDAYTEGHNADDTDKHNIQLEQNDKANELAAMLHITPEQLHDMADEDLEAMTGQDDKLDQAIYDYQVSTAKYQGVMDGAQDKVDMAAHQAAMETDNMTDLSRGTVRKATIKATGGAEDYEVYIISGNIATHDDGSIDVGNSDDMIIYYDPTTGRKEHADAMMFADLIEELPADDVKTQAVADAKENAIKEIAGIIDGTVDVGSQFTVTDADGTEHTYEVLADNGDGTAMITIDGNIPTELVKGETVQIPYPLADLQQMKDLEDQKRLEAAKAEREQMEKERAAQQTEETQPSFDFNQIINDNGNVVLVDVLDKDGNTKYPDSKLFLIRDTGAKAKVVELKDDGTIVPHAVNKEDVATISSMSLDEYKQAMPESSMIEGNSGENRGGIEAEPTTIEDETTPDVAEDTETTAPAEENAEETEQTPAMTLEDGTIVPMLEDGNPDFSKLTAEQTAELYDSQFGDDADSVISSWVSEAKKALDKANNMTVKGKTFIEQKAAKDAKEKAIADAQAAYDSAIAIRDAYNNRQLAKAEGTPEGRRSLVEKARRKFARLKSAVKDDAEAVSQLYRETIGSLLHRLYDGTGIDVTDTVPLTAEEYVASNLGAHSLNYEGNETSKGVKQETGLSREDFAKTQLLAADGKGTTIDALVHSLWDNRPSNLESLDTQDIRNALIDVLTSGFKASEARSYIENIRIAQAEKLLEEQELAAENAAYAEQQKAKEEEEKKKAELEKKAEEEKKKAELEGEETNPLAKRITETDEEFESDGEYGTIYNKVYLIDGDKRVTKVDEPDAKGNYTGSYYMYDGKRFGDLFEVADYIDGKAEEKNFPNKLKEGSETIEVPEDATDENPLGQQKPEEELPFSAKDNGTQQTSSERAADVEKNKVDDIKVVDNIVGQKTRKAFERLAKMMGANIQWQYSDKMGNGWIEETKDADGNVHRTIFITLDSSITEGAQFIFGHEMTHQIKNLNPAAYNELTQLVLDTYGSDAFDKAVDETMQRYSDAGFSGRERDYYGEEVVADAVGEMIRDLNLAHTLAMKMSHPLLAAIHEILQKIKLAFFGTEYSDVTKNIIRSIEQAYVKTANMEAANAATQEGEEGQRLSLRTKPEPKKTQKVYKLMRLGEDGKLYPLFIGSGEAIELGKWYDADSPKLQDLTNLSSKDYVGTRTAKKDGASVKEEYHYGAYIVNNNTGEAMSLADFKAKYSKQFARMGNNPNKKAVDWATDNGYRWIKIEEKNQGQSRYGGEARSYYNYGINGSGSVSIFAMRPGWHAGSLPTMRQIGKGSAKNLRDDTFVWVEGEIPAEIDYNEEAQKNADKDIPDHIPTDGYYLKATNANKEASQADKVGWYVAGAFRANRIMSDKETRDIIDEWNAAHPDDNVEYDWKRESGKDFNAETMSLEDTPKFSLKVYHGSGADFTEFDFDHMGEGAGSQAFGWGGYVTSSEKIGKSYAGLTIKNRFPSEYDTAQKQYTLSHVETFILEGSDKNEAIQKVKGLYNDSLDKIEHEHPENNYAISNLKERIETLDEMEKGKLPIPTMSLYEVDIPDDNGSNYIEFYKDATPEFKEKIKSVLANGLPSELKEMPEYKEAERKFYEENGTDESFEKSLIDDALFELERRKSNGDAYNALSVAVGDKLASKILSSLGYTGIKYPAGTIMGGAEENDTNYVIFKPEDMKITEYTKFSLRLKSAIDETETNPSDAQKESGNYKKGHIKFGGYDYTIENPKGSIRSGKDANGKEWKVTMHDTYGYIRGKFGKDGDHLDMFINDKADLDNWNGDVFVVDQVNPDGSFDEHKVMYGYDSMSDAEKAYLANYSKGWQGLGGITGASKAEFDKWLDTSNRKLKPFADYAKVKFSQAQSVEEPRYSLKDIKPVGVGSFGNIYNQFRGKAKAAIEFLKKLGSGEATAALHHHTIGDISLVWGDKKTGLDKILRKHPEVVDNLQSIIDSMEVVQESDNRVKLESPTHFAVVSKEYKGEPREQWLLTAYEKRESLENGKSMDTATSSLGGDTALSQSKGSAAKIDNSSETSKGNGEKFSLKDEKIKSVAEKFGVNEDDVAMYANAVEKGSTAEAARARANIKRYLLQANEDKISSFKDIIKYTKPINEALKENFGDLDAMIEERRKQVEAQRNAMEAARKRAQEEEEKRQKHLDELSLIPTDELDKRYMDAIANNDESTAREMLDESARRKGYGDVDSDYQGQGAWAAPSNPQYESDEARRADIENSPDVNLEDIALGYSLQPDDYFDNPRAYMNNTAYGLESAHVIKNALDAIKNGEKDVKVKVYRAVPTSVKEGKLRNGDWVTPSKKYAEMHGDNRLEGKYRIIEDEVPANQLWWDGNDANEFGFDDGKEYRYKNAKNNRKLNDLITYDNKGNVIPPSKRFNSRKSDIRFSLKAMMEKPEGWKQANKKTIHIAEAIERDPKFSLKNLDGTLIKAGTYFSGGGLVEEGLKGIIDPVVAVEYDEKISGVYRNNFGQHIVTADVRDVDPKELVKQIDGEVEYFHASPVCKNYSQAKSNHAELELDKETAASTSDFIKAIKPKVVTIENVKGYKDSDAMKTITDALDANGYTWDADVYNAADYGGYTNRERLIVRAVRDGKLPDKPKKMAHKSGWYEAVADIIPTLTEKKNGVAPWMDIRLKADGIDWRNIDKPLYVMGSAYADGKIPHAFADELLPTLRTKSGDVIVMPDGKVYRAMGRVLARVSGVSDDYKMPFSENLSHTIIGNGIPTQLTEHVIAPLLTGSNPKFSLKKINNVKDSRIIPTDVDKRVSSQIEKKYDSAIKEVMNKVAERDKRLVSNYIEQDLSDFSKMRREDINQELKSNENWRRKNLREENREGSTYGITDARHRITEATAERELEYRDVRAKYLSETYGLQGGRQTSLDMVDRAFEDTLGNETNRGELRELYRKARKILVQVGAEFGGVSNAKQEGDLGFAGTDRDISLFIDTMTRTSTPQSELAHTILHEMIHQATVGSINLVKKGMADGMLTPKQIEAVNTIINTYDAYKADRRLVWEEDNYRDYGGKDEYEFAAEMADAKQRRILSIPYGERILNAANELKRVGDISLWQAIKNALRRLFEVSDKSKMDKALSDIMDDFNKNIDDISMNNIEQTDFGLNGNTRFSLRYDQFEHDLNQWKKDNNLPKDAQRPSIPQRNAGESAVDFLRRVDDYRKQMALWKTAPTYEQHLLSDDTALGEFNRELQRGSVLKRIAFQDSMLAIRKAQEAIMKEVGVDRLNMAEDAYTAENRSHGKGKNEFEEYNNEFLQPLRKAYHQMKKVLGDSYDNVRIYMMAKHGLERDAQMAFKKSLEADYEDVAQRNAAYKAYKGDMNRMGNDSGFELGYIDFNTWRQKDDALRAQYSPSYMNYRYDKMGIAYDYSGLSALFDGSDFEEAAHKLIKDIESKYVTETHNLWDATNAATKKILRDGYKAGMMSKDTYQYVRDMYSHYIPLRGWDGTTADQVWDYIGGGKGAFNQTLKKAHGRTSIADDPIAYIENMAESGILLNNKNWVKQHLMLLAQNHPTSLLTLSKAWYVKSVDDNGNEEWIPATPQITSQMNSNQVKAAIDAFEQKMEQMAQTGDATQKRDGLNIAYPQTHSEEREHEVRVMKDGEEYVIYVNGDPQLAQAMNNTRAHRVREIQSGKLDRAAAWLGRKMAAAYTSLSPLFIPSNYFRDLTMTLASTAIREDAKYNYLLRKNLATSWNLGFILRDYQNGKLRDKVNNGNATPKEQMFYDFMMNGGETGFVSSLDVEDLKKKFKNDLKDLDRWKANPVKVGHTIMDGIEFLNRAIEDSNRFAVYMTSIQYGRSIDEAVNDAKDVTLNFNRKGTGEYGWQMIRNLYLFINPAVQSLQTLGALVKHHPFKFTAVTASWLASGVLVPIVNAALMSLLGGDDDKDKYWQFTKWDRRNNLIMWIPFTHEYVKIPLAQEFRAFYGIGDMIASKMMGGELAEESWSQYGEDLLGQVVDMLPLDPTGYDGNIAVSLMPNAIRPVFELAFNVDFTGKPLFKETEYNKYDPNFTKAYVGTPDWLVRASKMVNSIGNDYPDVQQNSIDAFGDPRYNLNNPAVVDHVLSSYLGGAYTMGSQVLGVLTKSLNDPKEIKVADIPLFSKFVSNPDDRPVTKKQGDEFWDMKENHDRAANTLSKLKKQAKVDGDYSMLERFYGSEEYQQYKQDDVKVKKYEEDKKKERAEESGEEYRPHKLNAEDIYKAHATPKDDFEDLKLKQLYTKLNGFKTSYDLLFDTAPSQSDGYYNTNKAAIDAIDEISLDKQEISELKKGFLDDGKDAYNAEDMKQIRDLRKKILSVLEKANKVVVANQKAKAKKK